MKFVDLFAGIGGFHVAISELFEDSECVFASEIDPDAREVYKEAFPEFADGSKTFNTDIREITGEHDKPLTPEVFDRIMQEIPAHNLLCAGFPCQPFSKSGKQRGMEETRGTLFYDILRILQVHRPKHVILENVRNLAGPRQRDTWDTIIKNLRVLGYKVASEPVVFSPHLLPEEEGGAPQYRERVFILCEYVEVSQRDQVDLYSDPLVKNKAPSDFNPKKDWYIGDGGWIDKDLSAVERKPYELNRKEERWVAAWQDFAQNVKSNDGEKPKHLLGCPIWLDAFKPKPDPNAANWKKRYQERNHQFYLEHSDWIDNWINRHDVMSFPKSRRKFEWQARSYQDTAEKRDLHDLVWQFRPSGFRVKPPTYLPALVAITQTSILGGHLTGSSKPRRITPREAARLQGLPDSHPLHPDDAAAYKQLGNAVNVGAVKHVAKALLN